VTAVDHDGLSGHIGCIVRGKHEDDARDLFGFTEPSQRDTLRHLGLTILQAPVDGRLDMAGSDGVGADIVAGIFVGDAFRQSLHGGFGRAVVSGCGEWRVGAE
jgi:hypothetical protein